MLRHSSIVTALILVLLAACSAVTAKPAPPEIHYGEDMCSECGMIINEPKLCQRLCPRGRRPAAMRASSSTTSATCLLTCTRTRR